MRQAQSLVLTRMHALEVGEQILGILPVERDIVQIDQSEIVTVVKQDVSGGEIVMAHPFGVE